MSEKHAIEKLTCTHSEMNTKYTKFPGSYGPYDQMSLMTAAHNLFIYQFPCMVPEDEGLSGTAYQLPMVCILVSDWLKRPEVMNDC